MFHVEHWFLKQKIMKNTVKPNYFKNCQSLDEAKQLYKKLAIANHPDKGGDTAIMQAINAEYQFMMKSGAFVFASAQEEAESILYPEILSRIIYLEGLEIEIIGSWIWVSGETRKHKDTISAAGFKFAPKKIMWYYRPEEEGGHGKGKPMEMDAIRNKYGSVNVAKKTAKVID